MRTTKQRLKKAFLRKVLIASCLSVALLVIGAFSHTLGQSLLCLGVMWSIGVGLAGTLEYFIERDTDKQIAEMNAKFSKFLNDMNRDLHGKEDQK